ncbi:hypothetical protein C7S15_8302 [Burkholderia cepacia]|nr:hypothetical protein [Burkholderia cepacia]
MARIPPAFDAGKRQLSASQSRQSSARTAGSVPRLCARVMCTNVLRSGLTPTGRRCRRPG